MCRVYKLLFPKSPISAQKISNDIYVCRGPLELSDTPFCISQVFSERCVSFALSLMLIVENAVGQIEDRHEAAQEERLGQYCTDIRILAGRELTVSPENLFIEQIKTSCFLVGVLNLNFTCWILYSQLHARLNTALGLDKL